MSDTTASLTLRKIGNYVGLKIAEVLALVGTKADRTDLDAIPRFLSAVNESGMLALTNARIGDFCLLSESGIGYRLTALPISTLSNWSVAFMPPTTVISKSVSFAASLSPVIDHYAMSIPLSVLVIDNDGMVHYPGWRALTNNTIQLAFTETVAGKCLMTFQYTRT